MELNRVIIFSIVITALVIPSLSMNVNAYNYKYGSTQDEVILYGDIHYNGIFDGSTGELGDTTITPYTRLWIQGDYVKDIHGGTFRNINELELRNATEIYYNSYNYGNISNIDTVLMDALKCSEYSIYINNVRNLRLIQRSAELPSIQFLPSISPNQKKKIVIENTSMTIDGYIEYADGYSELYINDTTIIVSGKTSYNNSIISIDSSLILKGVDHTKLFMKNVVISLPSSFSSSVLDIDGIDDVYIDNLTVESGGVSKVIRVDNVIDGSIRNSDINSFIDSGIEIGYVSNRFEISNNHIYGARFDNSDALPVGISASSEDIRESSPTILSDGVIHVYNNTIQGVQVGIIMSAENSIVENNTISDLHRLLDSQYGTIGIAVVYTSTTVVSYINKVSHTIKYNTIRDAMTGIGFSMNAYATHNVILNCGNAMLGTPPLYNNYDGYRIIAPYNYVGSDYPDINIVSNLDLLLALQGKYDGDIVDGSPSYEFTFLFEPFALTKHREGDNEEFTIKLDVGWNYVFCPYRVPADYLLETLFNSSPYIKVVVVRETNGDYTPYLYLLKDTLKEQLPDVAGFYILSSAPTEITLPISNTKVIYTFKQGWNSLGYLLTGYTITTWIERMENIEVVVFVNEYGNYVPVYIHHPLEPAEREALETISTDSGVYMFFNKDIQYTINPPFYDKETNTFIGG